MNEFWQVLAHEINNPLFAARNALRLLADDMAHGRRDSPFLTIASEELERIADVMRRITAASGPNSDESTAPCLDQFFSAEIHQTR